MKRRLALILVLLFAVGCASTPVYRSRYDIALSAVERQQRGGEVKRFTDVHGNTFEDEFIKIKWNPSETQLGFALTNKTDSSMRVIWDEASYVGPEGKSDRVIHEGVKIADRGASMPPSVVIRGSTLDDLIEPTGNINWRTGYGRYDAGGWSHNPLVYAYAGSTDAEVRSKMAPDGTIEVLLPIDANGTIREYLFQFFVKGTVVPPVGS